MTLIYATYNQYCNSIDITTFDNMLLRIDFIQNIYKNMSGMQDICVVQ